MPRTPAQVAYQNRVQAAQVGITPEAYADRLSAVRAPQYTQAAYDPKEGNAIPTATLQHFGGGGTWQSLLGDRYEFLNRGGLGAPATGAQHGVTPIGADYAQKNLATRGFAGISPGVQTPPAGGTTAPGQTMQNKAKPTGFGTVRPPRPGLGTGFGVGR